MPCEQSIKVELANLICEIGNFCVNLLPETSEAVTNDILINNVELRRMVIHARTLNMQCSDQFLTFELDQYDYSMHPDFRLSF